MNLSTLVRPVRCQFCGDPMHYSGHALHVPEVRVEVVGSNGDAASFYAHATCWNTRMAPTPASERPNANDDDWVRKERTRLSGEQS